MLCVGLHDVSCWCCVLVYTTFPVGAVCWSTWRFLLVLCVGLHDVSCWCCVGLHVSCWCCVALHDVSCWCCVGLHDVSCWCCVGLHVSGWCCVLPYTIFPVGAVCCPTRHFLLVLCVGLRGFLFHVANRCFHLRTQWRRYLTALMHPFVSS